MFCKDKELKRKRGSEENQKYSFLAVSFDNVLVHSMAHSNIMACASCCIVWFSVLILLVNFPAICMSHSTDEV